MNKHIQTKKTVSMGRVFPLMIFLVTLIFSGCFSPWKGDKAKVTIVLSGGASPGRAAEYPPDAATLSQLEHTIELSNPPEILTLHAKGGKNIEAVVISGFWNISVRTFLDKSLYASGSAAADLQAGQDNVVMITMYPPYTVTFEVGGGSAVPDQTVERGGKVTRPKPDPELEGCAFDGWYTDTNYSDKWNFDTVLPGNIPLYAKWNELFTVTFYTGDGGSAVPEQIVEDGSPATRPQPNPSSAGYLFDDWYKDEDYTDKWDFNTPVTSNTPLYAKWLEVSSAYVTVEFDGIGKETIDLGNNGNDLYYNQILTVTVNGTYDSYQWYVDGSLWSYETSNSISITINWGDFKIGPHFLMAVVIKDGVPYSKELIFKVAYRGE